MRKQHVTYCRKALDKGYNYFLISPQLEVWKKVMGLPSRKSPNFWEFRDSQLGSCKIKWHLGATLWLLINNIIRGKPPSLGRSESCEFVYVRGSSMHQKCSNYALTNLLFSLCRSMWIVGSLVTRCNPHPKAITHPSYPTKMLWVKEHPSTPSSIIFIFGFTFESFKEFGGALGGTKALKQMVYKWFII